MLGVLVVLFKKDSRIIGTYELRKIASRMWLKTARQEPVFKGTWRMKFLKFTHAFCLIQIVNALYMSVV